MGPGVSLVQLETVGVLELLDTGVVVLHHLALEAGGADRHGPELMVVVTAVVVTVARLEKEGGGGQLELEEILGLPQLVRRGRGGSGGRPAAGESEEDHDEEEEEGEDGHDDDDQARERGWK